MKAIDKETIKQVIEGNASREDARVVAEWFSSSVEGQQFLSDMMDRDAYLLEEKMLRSDVVSPDQSERIFSKIEKNIGKKNYRIRFLTVAAVLFPFIIVASSVFYLNKQIGLFEDVTYSEIYVPKGENSRVVFQDGSEVFLNSDTRLRYPNKFGLNSREVELQGEAYFRVKTNKNRPFIVKAEKTNISVHGTSFNVDAYENEKQIDVVLDEGTVVFNASRNRYTMQPGQLLSYNKETGAFNVKNLRKSTDVSLWKNNIIHFADTPFRDVIKIMERRYNLSFVVMDSRAYTYSYTITTQRSSPENIFKELEKISPVRFEQKGSQVSVSVKKD